MVTFNLKEEWFDKIKSGEKTHEYREVKPYWSSRLKSSIEELNSTDSVPKPIYANICCAYPSKTDSSKKIAVVIKAITIKNGKNTDLKMNKPVYDIEFELLKI